MEILLFSVDSEFLFNLIYGFGVTSGGSWYLLLTIYSGITFSGAWDLIQVSHIQGKNPTRYTITLAPFHFFFDS